MSAALLLGIATSPWMRAALRAGFWRQRPAVLVIATSLMTGCATAGFEANGLATCPPVVEYSRELQAQAAEELAKLPNGSPVIEMTGDHVVMREQARLCFQ
jgi:hypothetical protein